MVMLDCPLIDLRSDPAGDLRIGSLYIPRTIARPWEVDFGSFDSPVPFRLGANLDVARDYYDWNWTWGIWW